MKVASGGTDEGGGSARALVFKGPGEFRRWISKAMWLALCLSVPRDARGRKN